MKKTTTFCKLLVLLLTVSIPTMGQYSGSNPNVASGKPVLATDSVADYEPGKATDDLLEGYAAIPGDAPAWIQIDLQSYYIIDGYGLVLPDPDSLPLAYTFQVSDNGSAWTDLGSETMTVEGTYGFDVTSPDPIRYVRINMTDKDPFAAFNEIYVYGELLLPPPWPIADPATHVIATGFRANWNEAATADGYVISIATDAGFTNHVPDYDNRWVGLHVSREVTGLDPGTTYYYKLRAYNLAGTSPFGNVISVTTPKGDQTITFDALAAVTYGDADFDLTATASSGLPVSYVSSDETVATVSGSTVTIVGTGTTTITASQEGDAQYYAAIPVAQDLVVNKKELTVSGAVAENKVYDGTTDAVISGATLEGVVGGDDVTISGETAGLFAQSAVGTGIAVSTSMSIVGTDTEHYTFVQPSGITAEITARELTVTGAAASDKIYDGTTDAMISGATLEGVVGGDDVSLSGETAGVFAQSDAGTGIAVSTTITITGADAGNYTLTGPVGLAADITRKELTVTADDKSREACASNPEFTISYTGFAGTEDASVLDAAPSASSAADESSTPGTYDITVSGGSDANYTLVHVTGTLTVTPDATPPLLTIQNITVQLDESNNAVITPADVVTGASDNCSVADTVLNKFTFSESDIGDVNVDVTLSDAAGNTTTLTAVVTVEGFVGIGPEDELAVKIYPNPTYGSVQLELNRYADELKVMDITGKTIIRKTDVGNEDVIELSGYNNGIYLFQLRFGSDLMYMKVVKK